MVIRSSSSVSYAGTAGQPVSFASPSGQPVSKVDAKPREEVKKKGKESAQATAPSKIDKSPVSFASPSGQPVSVIEPEKIKTETPTSRETIFRRDLEFEEIGKGVSFITEEEIKKDSTKIRRVDSVSELSESEKFGISISSKPQTFEEKIYNFDILGKGADVLLDVSGFVAEKTGLAEFERSRIGQQQIISDVQARGGLKDVLKFGFFAPTLATTTDIAKAFSSEKVFFVGKQKPFKDDLIATEVKFVTTEGRTGFGGGITQIKPIESSLGEVTASGTIAFGKETGRGVKFPSAKIFQREKSSFIGVEAGLGRREGEEFLSAFVGRTKGFSKPTFKGKSRFEGFGGFSIGKEIKGFDVIKGASKSEFGEVMFGGILKRGKSKPDTFFASGSGLSRKQLPKLEQQAFQQTSSIIVKGLKQKPVRSQSLIKTLPISISTIRKEQVISLKPETKQTQRTFTNIKQKDVFETKQIQNLGLSTRQRTRQKTKQNQIVNQKSLQNFLPRLDQDVKQRQRQRTKTRLEQFTPLREKDKTKSFFSFRSFRPTINKIKPAFIPLGMLGEKFRMTTGKRTFKEVPTLSSALKFQLGLGKQPRKRTKQEIKFGIPREIPIEFNIKLPNLF